MENILRFIKSTRDRLLGTSTTNSEHSSSRNSHQNRNSRTGTSRTTALSGSKNLPNRHPNHSSFISIGNSSSTESVESSSSSSLYRRDSSRSSHKRSVVLPSRNDLRSRNRLSISKNMSGNHLQEKLCDHITDSQWKDIFYKLQQKRRITGIVIIDPCFVLTNFLPTPSFLSAFNELSDFHSITPHDLNGQIVLSKPEHHQEWLKILARSESEVIFSHLCSITELFDRYYALLEDIERLSLHYYIIEWHVAEYCLNHFTSLATLSLENCINIDEPKLQTFGRMHNLRHVNLANCSLTEESLTAFLNEATNIRSLNVQNNVSLTGEFLSHKTMQGVERLDITNCWAISGEAIISMMFANPTGMPHLLELNLNVGICDESMAAICQQSPNLAHFRVDFGGFHKFSKFGKHRITLETFMPLRKLTRLRDVYLAHTTNFANEHLKGLFSSNPKLRSLTLRFRDEATLTDSCLEGLSGYCPELSYFEAPHNRFIGGKCMAELSRLPKLDTLILRGCNKLRNEQIRQFFQCSTTLKTIIFDGCFELDESAANYMVRHANTYKNCGKVLISMLHTKVERSYVDDNCKKLPPNLTFRCSNHAQNREHYNIFNGQTVNSYKLEDYKYWDGWY